MLRTGAQIVWEMLKYEGVEVVFGFPGGKIMHTYHPRQDYGIHHVLVRHEQCAAHAADGYARASGKVGVVMATSGPGATNLVTGIATAAMDSVPMVCFTGQAPTSLIGSDAFQETDITGITLPITKHNYLVTDVEELAYTIHEAFYVARSGRPGPVLIDLPTDVQKAETDFSPPEDEIQLAGYHPVGKGDSERVREAAALINAAERPVILAGHGVVTSGATEVLTQFVEKTKTPVALTLLGKGGFPESHPLCLGMMGMHGEAFVNMAIQQADLLLAFGMRFDDRVTGRLENYSRGSKKIHVEMDPAEINKIVHVDVGILGNLPQVLEQCLPLLDEADHTPWLEQISQWKTDTHQRDAVNRIDDARLTGPQVVDGIWRATKGDALIVTDVGQHQMWAAQYYRYDKPYPLITSGGLGTMGFGLPAAMGAQIARPDTEIWAIVGDGGFQMTAQELGTIIQEKLPVRIALINNNYLGMVRQWQELFYDRRYEATYLLNPDFIKLVEAYSVRSWRAKNEKEARQAIEEAHAHDGPAFIEFQVVEEGEWGNVYPMVPSGAALDEMIRRPAPDEA